MDRYTYVLATLVQLLLIAFQAKARVNPRCRPLTEEYERGYRCDSGTIEDIKAIPKNTNPIDMMLYEMNLESIDESTFQPFARILRSLMISRSSINKISPDAFKSLTKLQVLRVINSNLTAVQGSWFEGLGLLDTVDLRGNKIGHLDANTFVSAVNLSYLYIGGNLLNCDDYQNLVTLPKLQQLSASASLGSKCIQILRDLWKKKVVLEMKLDPHTVQSNILVRIINYIIFCSRMYL